MRPDAPACTDEILGAAEAARYFDAAAKLHEGGRLEAAVAQYRRAVALLPRFAPGHMVLGLALAALGAADEAEHCLRRAIALQPDLGDAYLALGKLYAGSGNRETAAEWFRTALRYQPDSIAVLGELWKVLDELCIVEERADVAARFVALRPDHVEAQWDYALHALNAGRLSEGWPRYAYRWKRPGYEDWYYKLPHPEWQGEPLAGKRILVWREQGVGDEIMFASCLPDLIEAAEHVIFACTDRLIPLFTRSFPRATVIDSARIEPPQPEQFDLDYHTAIGALPRYFRPTVASFPARPSYLVADPAGVARWRERVAALGPGPKIGICWRSQFMTADRARVYSTLDQWEPVLRTPGAVFVNLQYDDCTLALATAADQFGVTVHAMPGLDLKNDFDGVAALMQNLDLVLSVASSTGELAGALGRPVWRLLPAPPSDWTMLGHTDRRPWYPTMRVFTADRVGDWTSVFARVTGELQAFIRERSS